jgi:hypothetical protein
MDSNEPPDVLRNGRRRIYAFLAVALAVFLLGITIVGIVCKGYALPGEAAAAVDATPRVTPADAATALAAVNDEYKSASSNAAAALKAYESANAEVVAFLNSHFAELKDANSKGQVQNAGPAIETDSKPVETQPLAEPRTVMNPQWQEIHNQLELLQRRRAELLTTMLPSHPAVQAVESSIAEVEQRLKSVVKDIPAPADAMVNQSLPPSQPHSIANGIDPGAKARDDSKRAALLAAQRETEARYHKLAEFANVTQEKYNQAVQRESAARRRQQEAEAANLAALSAPPESRGSANARTTIYLCSLLAIAAGIVVSSRARVTERTFRAAAEVRQKLGLTVLGFLSWRPNESAREKPLAEPRWVRRTVLAAELVLAAAVVCIAATAFADKQFFHELLGNPLAACSQKFWC